MLAALALVVFQTPELAARVDRATARGLEYLLDQQRRDGSWRFNDSARYRTGPTALVTYSMIQAGLPKDHAAVIRALDYLETREPLYTYDASLRVLLLLTLGSGASDERLLRAAEVLEDPRGYFTYQRSQGATGLGDFSNTQFAITAHYALARAGMGLGPKFWERTLNCLLKIQLEDGSFEYAPNSGSSVTMTLGGAGALSACIATLERDGKAKARLMKDAQAAVDRADAWLSERWLDRTPSSQHGELGHWRLYGWQSLERFMAMSGRSEIGGRPWYPAAAEWICKEQKGDGAWTTEGGTNGVVNTAFALLTMSEATATTGVEASRRWQHRWSTVDDERHALRITAQGAPDCLLYLAGFHPRTRTLFSWDGDLRPRVERFVWYLNDEALGEEQIPADAAAVAADAVAPRFEQGLELPGNGSYRIRARAWIRLPEAREEDPLREITSDELVIQVQDLYDASLQEEAQLQKRHAWQGADIVELEASSTIYEERNAEGAEPVSLPRFAFDRFLGSFWVCDPKDEEPWIRIRLRKGQSVSAIRLSPAIDGRGDDYIDQPLQVLMLLNGNRRQSLTLDPADMRKGTIVELKRPLRLKELELLILQRRPGVNMPGVCGFAEIEPLSPADSKARR